MKDYYYFLGVRPDASEEEIRRAYRKLSLKYHPDKNPGDDFFADRFREVQEAYDTLSIAESRRLYDSSMERAPQNRRTSAAPVIHNFTSSKVRARKGDEVVLNWQTANADMVKILPFGLEQANGEKTFKITEFKDGQFHVVLQATNTLINKSTVQGISIKELLGEGTENFEKPFHGRPTPSKSDLPNRRQVPRFIYFVTAVLAVILLLLLYSVLR